MTTKVEDLKALLLQLDNEETPLFNAATTAAVPTRKISSTPQYAAAVSNTSSSSSLGDGGSSVLSSTAASQQQLLQHSKLREEQLILSQIESDDVDMESDFLGDEVENFLTRVNKSMHEEDIPLFQVWWKKIFFFCFYLSWILTNWFLLFLFSSTTGHYHNTINCNSSK